MKNSIKIIIVIVILVLSGSAIAQNAGNANGSGNATVVCPLAIIHDATMADLNFGRIVGGGSNGTVTVPDLVFAAAYTGGCAPFSGSGGAGLISPAHFVIYSQQGYVISIVGPNIVTISSGSNTMQVTMFFPASTSYVGEVNSVIGGNNKTIYTMNGSAFGCSVRRGLDLGGILAVPAGQAPGVYTGTFSEVVSYN